MLERHMHFVCIPLQLAEAPIPLPRPVPLGFHLSAVVGQTTYGGGVPAAGLTGGEGLVHRVQIVVVNHTSNIMGCGQFVKWYSNISVVPTASHFLPLPTRCPH